MHEVSFPCKAVGRSFACVAAMVLLVHFYQVLPTTVHVLETVIT